MNTSGTSTGLRSLLATAIFGALISSFGAAAAADPGTTGFTVKFADLNVTTPSGALTLYERIRWAARGACAYYRFRTDADAAACVQDAIARAVTKVNQPALFAVYDAKVKTSAPRTLVTQSR